MYQITAFIALFIAFVSLVLLTQMPMTDDQPAVATTLWGAVSGSANSTEPMRAGR
jgi:hypothetical protein